MSPKQCIPLTTQDSGVVDCEPRTSASRGCSRVAGLLRFGFAGSVFLMMLSCSGGGSDSAPSPSIPIPPVPPPSSPVGSATNNALTISVAATDADSDTLHYRWRATGGVIVNVDSPTTTWTPPATGGLHFVYVIVRDDRGGYSEQQVAVSSDAGSVPVVRPSPLVFSPPTPALDFPGGQYRSAFSKLLPFLTLQPRL